MDYTAFNGDSYGCRKNCELHYEKSPLKIVRASKQYLYDDLGNEYLDCVNNAAHVGHCHPHVVSAGQNQMAKLTSAQGFISDILSKYIKALVDTLPEKLSVCYLLNSGSEANDLALRLARQYTRREDVLVFDNAYHGNLATLIDISPQAFKKLPQGKKDFVHVVPAPDPFHAPDDKKDHTDEGKYFFDKARSVIDSALGNGRQIACFFSEIIPVKPGVIVPPKSYFTHMYNYIREIGGLCIADEVQTGLGRTGDHFWAFESFGVVPDILTVGKPLGNGHPLSAVITTREIADSLGEFLTSYGGNPVACSIGLAVLDVIRNEKLMSAAKMVGRFLLEGLRELQSKHVTIGDVRGVGLFIGVELVVGRPNKKPATQFAESVLYTMKEEKIIVGSQGADRNVIVIAPPLCFTMENARRFLKTFDTVLEKIESGAVDEAPKSIIGLNTVDIDLLGSSSSGTRKTEDDDDESSFGREIKRQRCYEEMD